MKKGFLLSRPGTVKYKEEEVYDYRFENGTEGNLSPRFILII